jgi:hypothetical protein
MFKTAGVRCIRRVSSALLIVSLAVLLGACAHTSPPDPGGVKSWVVENVASKSTEQLYADLIKPGVFERSSSNVIDGYTVESGNLLMPDKSVGSLVTVRSGNGGLTAVIEQPGNNGLLVVKGKGESRFTPFPKRDYSLPDMVVEDANTVVPKSPASAGPYVIDMLIGYSRSAVEAAGGDAHANALAQVESVNLALRNSLVTNVSLKLVGVQVVENNYSITPGNNQTLGRLPEIFSEGMKTFEPDMVYGVFSGHPDDSAGGWAYTPGRFAIGNVYGEAFRHEVGHNAGGIHCQHDGGGIIPYGYGFANGKTFTAQCGNANPYYSTPAVRDAHGLPIGNAATADMARVWRENAERMSIYSPPFDGERMILAGIGNYAAAKLTIARQRPPRDSMVGVLAYHADEGPVQLQIGAGHPVTTALTATLMDRSGTPYKVKLQGKKSIGTCVSVALNTAQDCSNGADMHIVIEYSKADNPDLPRGQYTGEIRLYGVSLGGSWSRPIRVAVSISGD